MFVEYGENAARGRCGLFGGVPDSGQEEFQPGFPIALHPHAVEKVIVDAAVLLEIEAEIENRFASDTGGAQQQRVYGPANAAISVQKRVNGIELDVDKARPVQSRE